MSIVDNDNCLSKDTMYIFRFNFPLQLTSTSKLMNCYGELSGLTLQLLEVLHHIHMSGLMVVIHPIGSGDSITGLSGGSYFVKVTDANGCDTVATFYRFYTTNTISW